MSTTRTGFVLASFTALLALAAAAPAEAGGKSKSKSGLTIVLGDGYPGYGFRNSRGGGCGWLLERYEDTGNPKWYNRWHLCRYGW